MEISKCRREAVQLLGYEKQPDGSPSTDLRLFESNFEKILGKPELKDVPMVIVSVAGAMREGKSLLIYLIATYFRQEGWLQNSNWSNMLEQSSRCRIGMPSWSNGWAPGTEGVIAYGAPFILQRSNEEKIAVLLLDSEGDSSLTNTKEHHAYMYMFCCYLSALLIFNKRGPFNAETLENFQFLLTMAKAGSSEDNIVNTLQKTAFMDLCVLMRDIPRSKCRAGAKQYYEWLKSEVEKSQRSSLIKDCIEKTYKKFSFNFMPEPGQRIRDGECDSQNGLTVSDVGEEFCHHLKDFMDEYLHPDRLLEEYVTSKPHPVYASDLLGLVKTYGNSIIKGEFAAMSMIPTGDKMDGFRRKIQEKISEIESPEWKDFDDTVGKYHKQAIETSKKYLSEAQQVDFLNRLNWVIWELQQNFANDRAETISKLLIIADEKMEECHGKYITRKKKIRSVERDLKEAMKLDDRDVGNPQEELGKIFQEHLDSAQSQNLKSGLKIAGIGIGCGIIIGVTAGVGSFIVLPIAGATATGIAVGAGASVAAGVGGGLSAAAANAKPPEDEPKNDPNCISGDDANAKSSDNEPKNSEKKDPNCTSGDDANAKSSDDQPKNSEKKDPNSTSGDDANVK